MKSKSNFPNMPASRLLYIAILIVGSAGNLLLSPKWTVPIMAWIAPACILFYFRNATLRFRILWFLLAMIISQMISSYDVAPFPLPVLAIVSVIAVVKILLVYLVDKWYCKKTSRFISTLVFPAVMVTKEFIDISFSGGAWWSVASSQYGFSAIAQLASIAGLTGISFLVYWFASVTVWSVKKYFDGEKFVPGILVYGSIFAAVMVFGFYRFYSDRMTDKPAVKVAGISVPTVSILESCYKDVYHQNISIDLKASMVSKQLQKVNASMVPFIEDPNPLKFVHGYEAMNRVNDSLFILSQQAADKGAKIIIWSEANAVMPSYMQDSFIERGQAFAARNKVYLLMTIAAFEPGTITPGKMFLENKSVFLDPGGKIINVFHKNNPVPFIEPSIPGDGKIPAIKTPYGIVSTSICYDADMPKGMQQLGQNKSDVLLLPSGDWYDIAPYHSYMAIFRGIENGCAVVRQASGGLSLVTDYRGRAQASFDYYKPGTKAWIADIIPGHVRTVYSYIGDSFAWICIVITVLVMLSLIVQLFLKRKGAITNKARLAAGSW